ncbi:MAG: hypothetical protein IJU05_07250 [Schwartzia sp.]|nr:hypothetical protein [Schwartzia sp. (in: firmicutes)]
MRMMKKTGLALALAIGVAFGGTAEASMPYDRSQMEQQLDLLSAQKDIWEKYMCLEEAIGQGGHFAVTDLDQNGRPELLFTTTVGKEEVIENWGYEVNEAGDGVSLLKSFDETNETDILHSPIRMYFACQIDKRYYIFQDARWVASREGGWTRKGRLSGLCLSQGELHREHLGSFFEAHLSRDLPPTGTIYRDRDNKVIDAKAYANLAKTYYDNCHPNEVTIGWVSLSELWKAKGSREKVRALFARSWADFHAEELDEGPVH